jgi:tetratricopeptide (TPR) repeat protein
VFFSAKQYQQAVEQFQIVVTLNPKNPGSWQQLGIAFLHAGDLANAEGVAKQLEVVPNFAGGHELKGQVFTGQKRYDEAIAEFRKAIALEPDNAGLYYLLSTPLWESGRRTEAIAALEEAVRKDPKNADYAAALARYRKEAGVGN